MVKSIEDMRRLDERGKGARTALASALGYSTPSRVTHICTAPGSRKQSRPIDEHTARAIEKAMGWPARALDQSLTDDELRDSVTRTLLTEIRRTKADITPEKQTGALRVSWLHARAVGRDDPTFAVALVQLMK